MSLCDDVSICTFMWDIIPFGTRNFLFLSPLLHQRRRQHLFEGDTDIDKNNWTHTTFLNGKS